jgi:hypothetical protein
LLRISTGGKEKSTRWEGDEWEGEARPRASRRAQPEEDSASLYAISRVMGDMMRGEKDSRSGGTRELESDLFVLWY